MIGSLRASVAQLESEKYQLQQQMADARQEARRLEDRLVESEARTQSLARQLDDARRVGRNSRSDSFGFPDLDDDDFPNPDSPPRRSAPASQPRGRKLPFAQIPGRIQPLPDDESFDGHDDYDDDPFSDSTLLFPSPGRHDDQSRLSFPPSGWLPVARGIESAPNRVR